MEVCSSRKMNKASLPACTLIKFHGHMKEGTFLVSAFPHAIPYNVLFFFLIASFYYLRIVINVHVHYILIRYRVNLQNYWIHNLA